MDWSRVWQDVANASPATVLFLAISGGALAYVVLIPVAKAIRLILQLLGRLLPTSPRSKPPSKRRPSQSSSTPGEVHNAKPGKSLKQLMKESRKAAAVGQGHEKLPDSPYLLNSLRGHGDAVLSVDVSPGDSHILTACGDQVLRIYNMKGDFASAAPALTRQVLRNAPIGAVFWGASDTTAAVVSGLGQVADFVVTRTEATRAGPRDATVCESRKLHGEQESVLVAGAPSSGSGRPILVTMTRRKEVRIVTGAGALLAAVEPNGIENYQVVCSSDGRFVAVTTWGSDVKLWELAHGRDGGFRGCVKAMELKGHRSGVLALAFNPSTTRAVTASKDGSLRVWRIDVRYQQQEDPKCIVNAQLDGGQPYALLAWCDNDVIVGVRGTELHFISAATGKVLERVSDAHDKRITALRATAGRVTCGDWGRVPAVATAGLDGKCRLWAVPGALLE